MIDHRSEIGAAIRKTAEMYPVPVPQKTSTTSRRTKPPATKPRRIRDAKNR